jgi:alpha-L-rhamnosidase
MNAAARMNQSSDLNDMGAGTLTSVVRLRFEHLEPALGIGAASPRVSWQVRTNDEDWHQTAYEIEADGRAVRMYSADQVLVPWPFQPMASRERKSVRVRVACGERWSGWSEPTTVEAGLLSPSDWSARFISPRTLGGADDPAPIFTRSVVLRPNIAGARMYVTAHGAYIAKINGERVGTDLLRPGWTSYSHRLRYQTYDVARLLQTGENRIEVLVGNGWFRGRLGWTGERALYGQRLALLAQVEVTYTDGTRSTLGTNERWGVLESGVVANDIYDGEHIDLRNKLPRIDVAEVVETSFGRLVAAAGPPVRVLETRPVVKMLQSSSGKTLVDFGQNLVGWVRVQARNTRDGGEITVRHAEILQDGELCVRPLRSAKATDTYVTPAADQLILEPSLTYHGFRYAEIVGCEDLQVGDLQAVVIGSDLRRTGWFTCSDPDLERLHENVVWSMRGNFVDVPTDCPQRDERLGWTGDVQLFAPTASFLYDTAGFLTSWLSDLAADQHPDGTVSHVVPSLPFVETAPAAGWGDAATIVPWVLYQRYGDVLVLGRQFDSMCAWVDKVESLTRGGLWVGGFQYGDWLDPDAPPEEPGAAKADPDVIATAYLVRSAEIVASAAAVLGREREVGRYATIAARSRRAFQRAYVDSCGRITSDAPTVYAMALEWALLATAEQRVGAARRLAELVEANAFRTSTGFLGTPLITDALSSNGHPESGYRLLFERDSPSWLYAVAQGGTTMWERFDSMRPDGTLNPGEMTSFNHFAPGAIADWLHRVVAGLAPESPGYRSIQIKPLMCTQLTHASARFFSPYGESAVSWRRMDGVLTVEATVPVGTVGTVHLPGREAIHVGHGNYRWEVSDPYAANRPEAPQNLQV